MLRRDVRRRIRRLAHLPLRHRIITLVLRLLLGHWLWTIRNAFARSGDVALGLRLRSCRSLIDRLRGTFHSGTHAIALSIVRRLSRRARHLAIAPVSVLIWTAPGWALRLLAAIVGISRVGILIVIGVLCLPVVPIRAIAVSTTMIAAIVARLRTLVLVGRPRLIISSRAGFGVIVVG